MVLGTKAWGSTPRPQNQVPKRSGSSLPVAASAVPFAFMNTSRNGSDTVTAAPFNMPRRMRRRLIAFDLMSIRASYGRGVDGSSHGRHLRRPDGEVRLVGDDLAQHVVEF